MKQVSRTRFGVTRLRLLVSTLVLLLAMGALLRIDRHFFAEPERGRDYPRWGNGGGRAQARYRNHQPAFNREPSGESDAIADLAQHLASSLVKKEVVPSLDIEGWTAVLLNPTNSASMHRHAARALARDGSDATFSVLTNLLSSAPSSTRSAIAEAMGHSNRPEAAALVDTLLKHDDEATARAAVRAVSARSSRESISRLESLLFEQSSPLSVRTEAALSLGESSRPEATEALIQAAAAVQNTTVAKHVLQGLGTKPFVQTEQFFTEYLSKPSVPTELRVSALESLAASEGTTAAFLIGFAARETEPEVRAAAAWAIGNGEEGSLGPQLIDLLRKEQDPEVRRRLFQALRNQYNSDPEQLLQVARAEHEPATRIAAYDALAGVVRSFPNTDAVAFFDQVAAGELLRAALSSNSGEQPLECVNALKKARTPESLQALRQIAAQSEDPKVSQAALSALEPWMRSRRR